MAATGFDHFHDQLNRNDIQLHPRIVGFAHAFIGATAYPNEWHGATLGATNVLRNYPNEQLADHDVSPDYLGTQPDLVMSTLVRVINDSRRRRVHPGVASYIGHPDVVATGCKFAEQYFAEQFAFMTGDYPPRESSGWTLLMHDGEVSAVEKMHGREKTVLGLTESQVNGVRFPAGYIYASHLACVCRDNDTQRLIANGPQTTYLNAMRLTPWAIAPEDRLAEFPGLLAINRHPLIREATIDDLRAYATQAISKSVMAETL